MRSDGLKRFALAATLALTGLGACSPKAPAGSEAAKYAGLEVAIRDWHAAIDAAPEKCPAKDGAKGCQTFEVACKAERPITPDEAAKGVSAKIVAAMSWEGWDPKRGEYQPGSDFAEFTKSGGAWSRQTTGPVNLATCAGV